MIPEHPPAWHLLSGTEAADHLGSDTRQGLGEAEVRRRLQAVGPNQLVEVPPTPWWVILLQQFQDFMVLVLLAATAISYGLGEHADAATIIVIVVLNAVLGFAQEYRAERSLAALRQLTAPQARLRRGGVQQDVSAAAVVPGDILLLEAGDRIPADARLLTSSALEADEAALTGESVPVLKEPGWCGPADTPLADRRNMVYMGTVVTLGRGEALVVATGMATEMGRIAGMIQEAEEEPTPLQQRLDSLGRYLIIGCLAVCALVVAVGIWRGEGLQRMFLTGVSLAVAAIPEGLPAIVTVCLALGVQRMIRRKAIVRRLQAVETLGCATVILSDKTGTMTKNEMMVRAAWAAGRRYDVTGDGYRPVGDFCWRGRSVRPQAESALWSVLRAAALCSNAELVGSGRQWAVQGDPTEGALVVAAAKAGWQWADLLADWERTAEAPFSSERRMMSVLVRHRRDETAQLCVKGAPDAVLRLCTHLVGPDGLARPMTEAERAAIVSEVDDLARQALRVLAVALRPLPAAARYTPAQLACQERELAFAGLVGMIDPPRPEVRRAVGAATVAGIRTVMITGDHPATALAVARELGITGSGGPVITGRELDAMSDRDLVSAVATARVFARVSPLHKLRIVRAFRSRGEVVAMTGDGVNDAPAVKEADIGVAMGRGGTDVTKEAAQLVLADDNFSTIVAAVEEGRGIYDNIRKFIRYLLSCNTGEVLVMLAATVVGLPLPLLPMQILWVNLATDGLPALALGIDPPEPGVMQRPPRRPGEGVFARGLGRKILLRGTFIALATLSLFIWGLTQGLTQLSFHPEALDAAVLTHARTLALAGLVMAQLLHVFDCRSERRSAWGVGLFTNRYLVAAVATSVCLLLAAIYWPPLAQLMATSPLTVADWALVVGVTGTVELAIALRRGLVYRHVTSLRADYGAAK